MMDDYVNFSHQIDGTNSSTGGILQSHTFLSISELFVTNFVKKIGQNQQIIGEFCDHLTTKR